jgi:hypothetical protein
MGFEDEYARKGRKKNRDPIRPFLPVLGLLLAVALAAISWVIHEPLRDFLVEQFPDLPQPGTESFEVVGYIAGGVVFVVLLMIVSMLYTIFAPRPEKLTSESQLKRERDDIDAERRAKKKRQQQIRRNMAKERAKREKDE